MIDKGLAKVLAVLGLFTMGFLFLLRDSLAESLPVELRELLRGSGDDRRNFGPARPNDQVGARKPHAKTKMLAMAKGELDLPQIPVLEIDVPVPPFPSKSEVRLGMSRAESPRGRTDPASTTRFASPHSIYPAGMTR